MSLGMNYSNGKVAGALIFVAVTQFVLGLVVSEALYPDYSIADNYISDLGVGPSSAIFNASVFLMGLLILVGAYFVQHAFKEYTVLVVTLVLTAVGTMGVGIFTEDAGILHPIVSVTAFLFSGLSALFTVICTHIHKSKLTKMPFSAVAIALGLTTLTALALFIGGNYLGIGPGGMERIVVYPALMWGAAFGGYLMAYPEEPATQKPQ
jgi:hypothetical membrane protein